MKHHLEERWEICEIIFVCFFTKEEDWFILVILKENGYD